MAPTKFITKGVSKYGIPIVEKAADEFAHSGVLRDSYRFMKGLSRYIPGETPSGQTSMLPNTFGRRTAKPALTEVQKHQRLLADIKADAARQSVSRPAPRDRVMALARGQELAQKRAQTSAASTQGPWKGTFKQMNDADAAIKQQNAMDRARAAGQITPSETVKTNRILNQRRRRVM